MSEQLDTPQTDDQIAALTHHVSIGLKGGAGLGDELQDIKSAYGEEVAYKVEARIKEEEADK